MPPCFFQHGVHMIKFFQFLKITFKNVVKIFAKFCNFLKICKVRSHFWLKFGMVNSIYGALMLLNFLKIGGGSWGLELNFLGFKLKKTFGKESFMYLSKIKFGKKNFPKTTPVPKKFKKMTKYSFFCKFLTRYD